MDEISRFRDLHLDKSPSPFSIENKFFEQDELKWDTLCMEEQPKEKVKIHKRGRQ